MHCMKKKNYFCSSEKISLKKLKISKKNFENINFGHRGLNKQITNKDLELGMCLQNVGVKPTSSRDLKV